MRYGSVCSGIEAASVAWAPLGWKPAWFAEIAKFPSAVLAHHYPDVPNHGSLLGLANRLDGPARRIDLLVGGTPCQSFSVAGLRGGLADSRGNLALEFARLAAALRPRWIVWENVPGVLSADGGRAFGSIVGALVELGYGVAWRVLDARFFGVPQRRRRVFLVGHLGAAAPAGAVLFEPEGLRRNPPQGGEAREDVAGTLGGGAAGRGWSDDTDRMTFVDALCANGKAAGSATQQDAEAGMLVARCLRCDYETETLVAFDPTQVTHPENRSSARGDSAALTAQGRPPHIVYAIEGGVAASGERNQKTGSGISEGVAPTLDTYRPHAVAFNTRQDPVPSLAGEDGTGRGTPIVPAGWQVRRLTPTECERLQGLPDGYTAIPGAKDGPRYAALGNSMAVPVMSFIGRRIALVEAARRDLAQLDGEGKPR